MIRHVAIIGMGTMGPGMAARLARGGLQVTAYDVAPAAIERAHRLSFRPLISNAIVATGRRGGERGTTRAARVFPLVGRNSAVRYTPRV